MKKNMRLILGTSERRISPGLAPALQAGAVSRQIIIDVPEKVLLAEKMAEVSFARELRILAAVKLYESSSASRPGAPRCDCPILSRAIAFGNLAVRTLLGTLWQKDQVSLLRVDAKNRLQSHRKGEERKEFTRKLGVLPWH